MTVALCALLHPANSRRVSGVIGMVRVGTSLADYQCMNASIPNLRANFQAPAAPAIHAAPSPEPAPAGAGSTDSAGGAAGRSDFAGTLHHVTGRSGPKSDPGK